MPDPTPERLTWLQQRVQDFRDYPPSPAERAWVTALVLFWIWYGWFSP